MRPEHLTANLGKGAQNRRISTRAAFSCDINWNRAVQLDEFESLILYWFFFFFSHCHFKLFMSD